MNAAFPEAAVPAVIIGAGRSGTNMLRDCLSRLDGIVTWPCDEINYLWRHGNRDAPTDELDRRLATPAVTAYIRTRFVAMARRQGLADEPGTRRVMLEKTCANALRVPFVDAVLPEARFLHIVRDGRDVVASASRRWKAPLDIGYLAAKARYVPPSDLPHYALRYASNRLAKLRSADAALSVWGPRFEGMRELAAEHDLETVCAAQWARCVDLADEALERIDPERVLSVRYEDFVREPSAHLDSVGHFLGSPFSPAELDRAAAGVSTASVGKGGRAPGPTALDFMATTLQRHGYL